MKDARTKVSAADFAVIAVVLTLALLFPLISILGGGGSTVIVSCDGVSDTYPLSEDRTVMLKSNGHTLTLKIEDGAAFIESSDCKDGICIGTGRISRPGGVIVCAPAHVTVRISGEEVRDDEADAVVR